MKKNKQLVESYKKRLINSIAEDVNLNEATRYMMPEPTMEPGGGIIRSARRLGRWAGNTIRGGWVHPGTGERLFGVNPSLLQFMYQRARGFWTIDLGIYRDASGRYFVHRTSTKGIADVWEVIEDPIGSGNWRYGEFITNTSKGIPKDWQHWDPSKGIWGLPGVLGIWSPYSNTPGLQEPEDDYIDSPPPSSDGPMYAGLSDQGTRNNPYL